MIILGDFNEIIKVEERRGQQAETASMRDFKQWLEDCLLIDLPFKNRKFTWRRGKSQSRIDRVLCEGEFLGL